VGQCDDSVSRNQSGCVGVDAAVSIAPRAKLKTRKRRNRLAQSVPGASVVSRHAHVPSITSHRSSMLECFSTSSILIPFTGISLAVSSAIPAVGSTTCARV
jgi:hypothetical protein